jgi:hypothetical protein
MLVGKGLQSGRPGFLLAVATVALLAWGGGSGARAAQVEYARLAKVQSVFNAIPPAQRDKVVLKVVLIHIDKADHSPIHLTVTQGGKTEAFGATLANGVVLPPLRQDLVAGGAMVETGQKPDTLREEVDITLALPAKRPIPVRYLLDAAQQAQEVIRAGARQMAGMLAIFLAPAVHGVVVGLGHCCGEIVVLQADDRRQSFTQDAKGRVALSLSVLERFDGGVLTASAPVVMLDPDTD